MYLTSAAPAARCVVRPTILTQVAAASTFIRKFDSAEASCTPQLSIKRSLGGLPLALCPKQASSYAVARRNFRTAVPVMMGRRAAKIANKKGKTDALKAKVYGRLCKQIVNTAKGPGGPDPVSNAQLAAVIKAANNAAVPKDLIERNLKKATDAKQADFTEVSYEAYGFGGVGVVIEGLTDNLNRAYADVKDAVKKSGAKMAEPGSVMFQFERVGSVIVNNADEEQVFEIAIEAGAEDVVPLKAAFEVKTAMTDFAKVRDALADGGFEVDGEKSRILLKPVAIVDPDDEAFEQNAALFEKLLELDDVDDVYSNQVEDEEEEEE